MKPIVWRELRGLMVHQRRVESARANGCRLEVVVYVGRPTPPRVTGDDTVCAVVERKRKDDGGWDTLDRKQWSDAKPETLAAAREWCEAAASEATI